MTKTLVLYVFHICNDRVKQFIDNAIFKDESVDFIVISNDKENKFEVPEYAKNFEFSFHFLSMYCNKKLRHVVFYQE